MVMTLESSGTTITPDLEEAKLFQEDVKQQPEVKSEDVVFATRRVSTNTKMKFQKKVTRCYSSGDIEHSSWNCRKTQTGNSGEGSKFLNKQKDKKMESSRSPASKNER